MISLLPTQSVEFRVSPVDSSGNPSSAVLSGTVFTNFNQDLITVLQNPEDTQAGTLIGDGIDGSAILIATSTATEADGTQRTVRGAVVIAL